MTQGEYVFYLREIHGHWCASNVSTEKLAALVDARLIELQPGGTSMVRLTAAGRECKLAGRSKFRSTLSTSRLTKATRRRPRITREKIPAAKPLV